jgi:hypothetical protein
MHPRIAELENTPSSHKIMEPAVRCQLTFTKLGPFRLSMRHVNIRHAASGNENVNLPQHADEADLSYGSAADRRTHVRIQRLSHF